ncbi:MAG TPA: hypothetical protein VHD63_19260, partial [Ktedonobacteraceae bacterium]|nr:hypothetical protein [Ktedonobacteraceae bacterium]
MAQFVKLTIRGFSFVHSNCPDRIAWIMNPGAWRATLLWLAFLTSVVSAADLQREEIWSHLKPFFDP